VASAPTLSHGGSRLNASKPEANPKTRYPTPKIIFWIAGEIDKSSRGDVASSKARGQPLPVLYTKYVLSEGVPPFGTLFASRRKKARRFWRLSTSSENTGNPFCVHAFQARTRMSKSTNRIASSKTVDDRRHMAQSTAKIHKSISKSVSQWNTGIHPQGTLEERERTSDAHFKSKQQQHLRPSPNERTCMGWHKRHASVRRGWRGIYVPRR